MTLAANRSARCTTSRGVMTAVRASVFSADISTVNHRHETHTVLRYAEASGAATTRRAY